MANEQDYLMKQIREIVALILKRRATSEDQDEKETKKVLTDSFENITGFPFREATKLDAKQFMFIIKRKSYDREFLEALHLICLELAKTCSEKNELAFLAGIASLSKTD